jgi:ribosomal protein L11 methylase PrmA
VRAGGALIAAGIIDDQSAKVVAALEQNGLSLVEQRQVEDWVCLLAQRSCEAGPP